jgi:hypothetical protein
MNKIFITITLLLATTLMNGQEMEFSFKPVPDGSGFRMDDYWVWCGSPAW